MKVELVLEPPYPFELPRPEEIEEKAYPLGFKIASTNPEGSGDKVEIEHKSGLKCHIGSKGKIVIYDSFWTILDGLDLLESAGVPISTWRFKQISPIGKPNLGNPNLAFEEGMLRMLNDMFAHGDSDTFLAFNIFWLAIILVSQTKNGEKLAQLAIALYGNEAMWPVVEMLADLNAAEGLGVAKRALKKSIVAPSRR